ncbi:MAG TPA: hypothetical protein VL294_09130 [Pseudolysinimonas sp.]|jgi:hypothetical protein|nr:hypothetical protein [Pseudolysinimonas sp.]
MEREHEMWAREISTRVLREFRGRVTVSVIDPVASDFTGLNFSSGKPNTAQLSLIVRGDLVFQAFAFSRDLFESASYEDPSALVADAVEYVGDVGRRGLVYIRRSPLGLLRPRYFGTVPGPAGRVLSTWVGW